MYFKDAVKSLLMIAEAPIEALDTLTYNIGGLMPTPSAKDVETAVRKHLPGAEITYNPDPAIMEYYASAKLDTFDDSCARNEWRWQPEFESIDDIVPDFIEEVRTNPTQYGL